MLGQFEIGEMRRQSYDSLLAVRSLDYHMVQAYYHFSDDAESWVRLAEQLRETANILLKASNAIGNGANAVLMFSHGQVEQ